MIVIILAIAIIGIFLISVGTGTASLAPVTPSGVTPDNTGEDSGPLPSISYNNNNPIDVGGVDVISYDETTWPSGDRVWNVCRAIARAEGANVPNSNPDRLNNPGDISDGYALYGGEPHSGSNVTRFPDKETGWQWLYRKISNASQGKSSVFKPEMTWLKFAQTYAANWQPWVNTVTGNLNVNETDLFGDYFV